MVLIEVNPFDVHFGDIIFEKNWLNFEDFGKAASGYEEGITETYDDTFALVLSIARYGIIDPIIVYDISRDEHLKGWLKKKGHQKAISGLWCWRGTERLRIARFLEMPKIKALLVDEKKDNPPKEEEMQKYFRKKVEPVFHEGLKRWDIKEAFMLYLTQEEKNALRLKA